MTRKISVEQAPAVTGSGYPSPYNEPCMSRFRQRLGDADNDLPALRIAGHPVAMGNGSAAVRAIAKHTVGHVDEGGLAQAFALAS